jgi:hypothetical protein
MTIKLPKKTLADKFLKLLGKKRGVIIPVINREMGSQYVHLRAKFENFWVALFRSKNSHLPIGVIDPEEIKTNMEDLK